MIVKVSTKGISIDVTSNQVLIDYFKTTHAIILSGEIEVFRIEPNTPNTGGKSLQLDDKNGNQYYIYHNMITSVNGLTTGFDTVEDLFNLVGGYLLGL